MSCKSLPKDSPAEPYHEQNVDQYDDYDHDCGEDKVKGVAEFGWENALSDQTQSL
jgi:hypothetical protein